MSKNREPADIRPQPLWLCIVFPPLAVRGRGWPALFWTTLLFLYGWLPAIPAALYYNSEPVARS